MKLLSHMQSKWHGDAISSSVEFKKVIDTQSLSMHKAIDTAYLKKLKKIG